MTSVSSRAPTVTIEAQGTSGTYQTPEGCSYIVVDAVAGGGAGGGFSAGASVRGCGGGGGAYAKLILAPGTYAFNVGGPAVGVSNDIAGTNGTSTTFSTTVLGGGKGGASGTVNTGGSGVFAYCGGAGGVVTTVGAAKYTVPGAPGTGISYGAGGTLPSGNGGGSFLQPGTLGVASGNGNGAQNFYGVGGSGCGTSLNSSGPGSGGIVIITEYY